MSKIALTPNASGTGTLTIAAPNTNTDRTLTLPDADITLGGGVDGVDSDYTSGTAVKIDGSGNVGIGISSPSSKLHVVGSQLRLQTDNCSHQFFNTAGSRYAYVTTQSDGYIIDAESSASSTLKVKTAGSERMRIDSSGEIYSHESGNLYPMFSAKNTYYTKSTTAHGVSSSWTRTGLSWSGVTLPSNVRHVICMIYGTFRNNGMGQNHTAFRLEVVTGGTTTYVGHSDWGTGIDMKVGTTSGFTWSTFNRFVNMLDYDTSNNQANMSAGNTYTIYVQSKDVYANGSNLYIATELGSHTTYTPFHGYIFCL